MDTNDRSTSSRNRYIWIISR